MTTPVIKRVKTQNVGFAPILRHYFEQSGIKGIIDENVDLDPRRKVLTHGEAAVALVTGILFQVMQLYRICQFASEKKVLKVILPHIAPEDYFDDRLADTLDALYKFGIGDLELMITKQMIDAFQIESDVCHNDTTSLSMYGDAKTNKTDESIQITFGHSKKHRKDLKQLVWSMSVSSDHAFPLFQQAYSGNTADVNTYVEQWHNLIDLLGEKQYMYIADSKLITHDTMAHIIDNDGFFIGPAPMYESYRQVFEHAIDTHNHELLIPYRGKFNSGFEVPMDFSHKDRDYQIRMIILFDHGLCARKKNTIQNHVDRTFEDFQALAGKLNRYKLKTREAIDKKCAGILKKHKTDDFFTYKITKHQTTRYKNKTPGRPSAKTTQKEKVVEKYFSVEIDFNEEAFQKALSHCGYFPLLTNQSRDQLTIETAMLRYKEQYKCEHIFRRSKGPYSIEPIYLHTPDRIEAFLFLFKIALQIIVLIERSARTNIEKRDRGLDRFMPNKHDVRNPRTEYLLKAFEDIVKGNMPLPDGEVYGFVSELNGLQLDILSILDVPAHYYDYQFLFNSG
jgi:transposase